MFYFKTMRNITIGLDDDTCVRVEKMAELKNTSAELAKSALLEATTPWSSPVSPEEFERLRPLEIEVTKNFRYFSASENIPREDFYDRKLR